MPTASRCCRTATRARFALPRSPRPTTSRSRNGRGATPMHSALYRVIAQVSKEKGIDRSIVVTAIEAAMLSAARNMMAPTTQLEANFHPEIGEVELFKILTVKETVTDPEAE